MRTSRNYHSTKLIPDIPVRVRRKPGYLKQLYLKYSANIKTINEDFIKAKYDKGADRFFDKAPLPNRYFTNEITLIPKNITTLFAYWEIREDTFENLKRDFNVYDNAIILLYKNDKLYRRIENLCRFGSYYILNIDANCEYKAILGFENEYGHFFEIAQSNYAISPSGRISNRIATIWGIPYKLNGKINITKYSKEFLPNEDRFIKEILNDNLYHINGIYKDYMVHFGSSINHIGIGSSIK